MTAKILIVDDEEQICQMLSNHFEFLGYDIETANNGQEALASLACERFEVVISDIQMPVMDGIELLRCIRKEYPMTHVIIISGYITTVNALACMRLGADTLIFKPIEEMQELEIAVENAIFSLKTWQEKFKLLKSMKK